MGGGGAGLSRERGAGHEKSAREVRGERVRGLPEDFTLPYFLHNSTLPPALPQALRERIARDQQARIN